MLVSTELLGRKLNVSRCAYVDVDIGYDNFGFAVTTVRRASRVRPEPIASTISGPRSAADMRAGRTLVVRDVIAELSEGEERETFQAIGIDAIICCPLVKDGQLTAMMAVHQHQPREWLQSEIVVREVVERCWAYVERVAAEMRIAFAKPSKALIGRFC